MSTRTQDMHLKARPIQESLADHRIPRLAACLSPAHALLSPGRLPGAPLSWDWLLRASHVAALTRRRHRAPSHPTRTTAVASCLRPPCCWSCWGAPRLLLALLLASLLGRPHRPLWVADDGCSAALQPLRRPAVKGKVQMYQCGAVGGCLATSRQQGDPALAGVSHALARAAHRPGAQPGRIR